MSHSSHLSVPQHVPGSIPGSIPGPIRGSIPGTPCDSNCFRWDPGEATRLNAGDLRPRKPQSLHAPRLTGGLADRGTEGYNAIVQLNTSVCAPIAQWIERRPPEPGAQVQFLLGAPFFLNLFPFLFHDQMSHLRDSCFMHRHRPKSQTSDVYRRNFPEDFR